MAVPSGVVVKVADELEEVARVAAASEAAVALGAEVIAVAAVGIVWAAVVAYLVA